jgi:hypothetical protein
MDELCIPTCLADFVTGLEFTSVYPLAFFGVEVVFGGGEDGFAFEDQVEDEGVLVEPDSWDGVVGDSAGFFVVGKDQ